MTCTRMASNFGETSDRAPTELVVVPELDGVGLTRQHSVPLVKIVTSTPQTLLSDVTKTPLNAVMKAPLNDTIKAPSCDIIKREIITTPINVIKTPLNDVTKSPLSDVMKAPLNSQLSEIPIRHEDESQPSCASNSSSSVTTSITSSPIDDGKAVSTFHFEQDWREAAHEPLLIVRCKTEKTTGELIKGRFGSGSRGRCIRLGKGWYTPTEFEAHCGRSASKDWKRSIRFQGQSLQTLIEEGFLQVHATSCACGVCLDDDDAAGSVRLHRPYKRKRRDKIYVTTDLTAKVLKRTLSEESGSTTPTVTLPVTELGELTVVPGLVLGGGTTTSQGAIATTTVTQPAPVPSTPDCSSPGTLTNLPLEKAWARMNEVLIGLERSVSGARVLLDELRERTEQESYDLRQKLMNDKEEAITQVKLEAQLSNMAKSSEGFLVQVRDDDGGQSLQPIMLDSLISNVPTLSPAPLINGVRKKCVNCNRESEYECSGCHNKAYCSDFCQRRDWINHQSECTRSSPPPEDPLSTVAQVPGYIFMLSD